MSGPPNVSHIVSGNYSISFPYTIIMVVSITFLIFLYKRYNPQRPPIRRIIYKFKVFLSLHPLAKPIALLFAAMLLIILVALLLYVEGNAGLGDALWLSTIIVADVLNMTSLVGTASRAVSMTIRSAGMLIYACMLGIVSETISSLFDSLRKGKSEVMEINHTLILGWSEKVGSLLQQLALENRSVGGGVIVVLAERDKEEMEADIAKLECDYLGSSVTCRSGNPIIRGDLQKVAVSNARAIIILASHENAEQSDARALRIVICLNRLIGGLTGRIIVEINDPNKEQIFKFVGGDIIKTVVVPNVTGRLMVQCALQPGLAKIWHDILCIDNHKFYVRSWQALTGRSFHDVLFLFPRAVPCGVTVADNDGRMMLNPNDTYMLKDGDGVVVIAEDANYGVNLEIRAPPVTIFQQLQARKDQKKILFCGWRPHIHDMIFVLNALVPRGSQLWLFNEFGETKSKSRLIDDGLNLSNLGNLKLVYKVGSAVNRSHLEKLPLESFHSIFILADNSLNDSIVHLDSRSLTTLLLIREMKSDRHATTSIQSLIITEILDFNTRNMVLLSPNLATLSSDYVLPHELVTRMLAAMTKNRDINGVFEDFFANEGHEICIRPACLYLKDKYKPETFNQIMVHARLRQEIVIGYRLPGSNQVTINPPNKQIPIQWCHPQLSDSVFVVISRKSPPTGARGDDGSFVSDNFLW